MKHYVTLSTTEINAACYCVPGLFWVDPLVTRQPFARSLAGKSCSLFSLNEKTSLTCFIQGHPHSPPPPKKRPCRMQTPFSLVWCIGPTYFLLNFIAHANSTRRYNKACLVFIYCYVYCNFQQNTPLLCAMSDSVVLLLIADAWQSRKLFYFLRTGHWTWGDSQECVESLSYPKPAD